MLTNEFEWGNRLPTLTARRVALRSLTEDDVPDLFALFSDAEVMRYWDSPPLQSVGDAAALLKEICEGFETRRLFQWGIADLASERAIGTCTIWRVDRAHKRAEIGFALARSHWGMGLAAEALAALIAFAFEPLGLHRLEADVDPRTERSLRVLERHGFKREGYLRERYHVGGEIQDAIVLGLLESDWRKR
jgi:ribosomal-protein-alanine N-acetyltransferase